MKASFGADISKLTKTSSVWLDDATYKDVLVLQHSLQKKQKQLLDILSNGKTFPEDTSVIKKLS